MKGFVANGDFWRVKTVDGTSNYLIDRTYKRKLATTDPANMTVYLSDKLSGSMMTRVLIHEMAHCFLWSYGLLNELHGMIRPEYWIAAEEWLCNFVADYGMSIYRQASSVLGKKAIVCIPEAYERMIA